MKFALISADSSHKVNFKMNCEEGDCTSFLNWIHIWGGVHLSFDKLRKEDNSYLKQYDVVMMSGHPSYMDDIIKIAGMLKDTDTVSMFYPEGSAQLYDNSIRNFHREYYQAWAACDIVSVAEEDKLSYYRAFVPRETLVRFIHVPITHDMEVGGFLVARHHKVNNVLVYGDNNPNHPIVAMACAKKIGASVLAIEVHPGQIKDIQSVLPGLQIGPAGKMSQNLFLRYLGRSMVHFYPTEWIGTARQAIACAAVGTPCIGNHDSHTQQRLWPRLGRDIYDVDGMCQLANRLIIDKDFYHECVRYAFDKMQFYSIDNTKRRFFDAFQDARKEKLKAKIAV